MSNKPTCDPLLLENQLCFPLYACARKIVAAYTPFLKELGLTYPQYITMMVLWQYNKISMRDLGKLLYLDSGTLTPLLKKLEAMGYLKRYRNPEDERILMVSITDKGTALRNDAEKVPYQMGCLVNQKGELFASEEVDKLKEQLYQIIHALA
ncbi:MULTISPECIES: MarR family winged helix-turn-helix transcriptional regulator [Selenomonas]|uniref:MarR family transcriptional regulator n=1 Tax=Selenomonas ruminis TaxID=2593411 RepID=A0A5D6W1X1_9FIRM|nr:MULTISPECIES: MarR family transcriptional regulator [unclassified Selenomonas]MBQ1868326.1 MarR family transcriptional regulator [Selenomonas sp.]TYZ20775.1 MarR family transcriptional regulator [Selenomonas sp. mPRGC5]